MKKPVALDTNVVIVMLYVELYPDAIGRHRRVKNWSRSDAEDVWNLIVGENLQFTLPILTEVSNLLDPGRYDARVDFHQALYNIVRSHTYLDINFETIAVRPEYLSLGVADAALLHLCAQGSVIVSTDRELCTRARAIGGSVLYVSPDYRDG